MNIGEKIRELRVAKLMTQAELAGSHITRNMLSCIENGSAQPSLSTILYIAKRLNVPAGFVLGAFTAIVFCVMRYLLEMEKARQGVRVGNEVRQRASKNLEHSPIWLFYYFYFFL